MTLITRSDVVVIFGFFALFLTIGFANSAGVFYNDWISYFYDDHKEAVASATALCTGLYLGTGPLVAVICEKLGFRLGMAIGSFLLFVGALATSFSKNALHLALAYGMSMGIGASMIFVPALVLVSLHNPDSNRRANSIAYLGVATGICVFPPVYDALSDLYTWQEFFFIYSAVLLNLFAFSALRVEPPGTEIQLESKVMEEEQKLFPNYSETKKQDSLSDKIIQLLRCRWLYLQIFAEMCWNFSLSILFFLTPQYAYSVANTNVTVIVSCIGYGSLTGRVMTFAFDCFPFWRKMPSWLLFSLSIGLAALPMGIYPFGKSSTYFVCCIFFVSLFYGMSICCQAPTHQEFVGRDLLVLMLGFMYFFDGLGFVLGLPVVIAITRATGRLEYTFYICAISYVLGGIGIMMVALIRSRERKRGNYEKTKQVILTKDEP